MRNPFQDIEPRGWFGIFVIIVLIVGGGWWYGKKNNVFKRAHQEVVDTKFEVNSEADIVLAYNTFIGAAGIVRMNEGMEPNENSRLFKEYGVKLQIKQIDKSDDVKDGLKVGALDMAYCTTDALSIAMSSGSSLLSQKIKQYAKINESRGADAIVAVKGVDKVMDLKGKSVAFASGTASNTLLINVLETAGLTMSDIVAHPVGDGLEAAAAFKGGQCDAALVWAPDDVDCVSAVKGSSILISTETATQIIADGLIISEKVAKDKHDLIYKVIKAWLVSNAEINTSASARKEAVQYFSKGFGIDVPTCEASIGKVRFSTLTDNKQFFGFDATFTGVTGDKMYTRMAGKYIQSGLATAPAPWKSVSDGVFIGELLEDADIANAPNQGTAEPVHFAPTKPEDYTAPSKSDKVVSLTFPTNSATLDDFAKATIDNQITGTAQGFEKAKIRVEGNTDNTGNAKINKPLSKRRADAVVAYLINEYKFPKEKFIVVGNGSDKPVPGCESNADEDCRAKNRRTEFQFIW